MQNKTDWEDKKYSCFSHGECEYFPCHPGIPEEAFNCLFCYCPLYALGKACGGRCTILKNGAKDCSSCDFPHRKENYGKVIARLKKAAERRPAEP